MQRMGMITQHFSVMMRNATSLFQRGTVFPWQRIFRAV